MSEKSSSSSSLSTQPSYQHRRLRKSVNILYSCYKSGAHCDAVIIIGNNQFFVHKNVFTSRSEYFRQIFQDTSEVIIHLEDSTSISSEAVNNVIKYIYTGKTNLKFLKETLLLAKLFDQHDLIAQIKKRFQANFTKLIDDASIANIPLDILKEFLSWPLLKSPELNFFLAIQQWILHDMENRMQHLHELMDLISLHKISMRCIIEFVVPFLQRDEIDHMTRILNAWKWHEVPECRKVLSKNLRIPRDTTNAIIIGGDCYDYEASRRVEIFNYKRKSFVDDFVWNRDINLTNYAAVIKDEHLVVIGGEVRTGPVNTIYSINLENRTVLKEKPMMTARVDFTATLIGNFIYVCGGYGIEALASVERHDLSNGSWQYMSPMKQFRYLHSAAVCDGKLYIMGGIHHYNLPAVNFVEIYDPEKNEWESGPPLKYGRSNAAAVTLDGMIYVMGGCNLWVQCDKVERFNPLTQQWSTVKSLPSPVLKHSAVAINGKILCTGGDNNPNIYEYDPLEDDWTIIGGLRITRPSANLLPYTNALL